MSPRIEVTCTLCTAKLVTSSVQEAIAWDAAHTEVCLGPAFTEQDAQ